MHEIGQLDIADRQLQRSDERQRVSYSREIGEARITHTFFGKAKVRIIRKYDAYWRALWLVAAAAAAFAAWQVWQAMQPPQPEADTLAVAEDKAAESQPEPQREAEVSAASQHESMPAIAAVIPSVHEIAKPASAPVAVAKTLPQRPMLAQSAPAHAPALRPASAAQAAGIVVAKQVPTVRPQSAPLAASSVAAVKPLPPRAVPLAQSAVPGTAVAPVAAPVVRPAASSPVPAAPLNRSVPALQSASAPAGGAGR